ncbi:hypothetical protein VTN49DRAFT_6564 [Thermomyces lanuginosus]|uniref:uncharacterized protein n=1 Tax=Thermomyces lanuginosus TaxID=5541 RepID=UPI0037442ED2
MGGGSGQATPSNTCTANSSQDGSLGLQNAWLLGKFSPRVQTNRSSITCWIPRSQIINTDPVAQWQNWLARLHPQGLAFRDFTWGPALIASKGKRHLEHVFIHWPKFQGDHEALRRNGLLDVRWLLTDSTGVKMGDALVAPARQSTSSG